MTTEQRLDRIEEQLGIKSVARPKIGTWVWMHGEVGPWELWKSTQMGAVYVDNDGAIFRHSWVDFDQYVADGTWSVCPAFVSKP